MSYEWQRWAIIASVAWAIAGSNAGMHLAVAPATLAYRNCVQNQGTDAGECRLNLHRDWAKYSGDLCGPRWTGTPSDWLADWLVGVRS
jgi:hypothetical protein